MFKVFYRQSDPFLFAFIGLLTSLPLQNILLYQLSYWHITESLRIVIFIIIEIPIVIYLLVNLAKKILVGDLSKPSTIIIFLSLTLFAWILSVVIFNWNNKSLYNYNLLNLQWLAMHGFYLIIGYFLAIKYNNIKMYKYILIIGLLTMWLQVILFFDKSSFLINLKRPISNSPIHLFMGTSFAIWSLFTLSVFKDWIRFLLFIFCALGIFFQGSRTSFYCFLFIMPYLFILFPTKTRRILFMTSALAIVLFIIIYLSINSLGNHRMFMIFNGSDTSLNYRIQILKANTPDIITNWLWGDYGGFYRYEFPANTWIHNFLSYWSQFGIIPFILLLTIFVLIFTNLRYVIRLGDSPLSFIIVSLTIYLTTAVLFAKSHNFSPLYLLFGMMAACLTDLKK